MDARGEIRIILFGPPGAGKGTQGERLAAATGAAHLASGDLVRAAIAANSRLGETIRGYNVRGVLVPDEIMVRVVTDRLAALRSWILDGFPRTIPQATALDQFLAAAHQDIQAVIDLVVPDDLLVERLCGRRQSEATGEIYHLEYNPPPPGDPGPFVQRADDQPEVIRKRLQVYHQETEPLVRFYRDKGLLVQIDGSAPPDEVTQAILRALRELALRPSPFAVRGAATTTDRRTANSERRTP